MKAGKGMIEIFNFLEAVSGDSGRISNWYWQLDKKAEERGAEKPRAQRESPLRTLFPARTNNTATYTTSLQSNGSLGNQYAKTLSSVSPDFPQLDVIDAGDPTSSRE